MHCSNTQETSRSLIHEQLKTSKLTQRQLAKKIGFKGHTSLSRFLAGKKTLSAQSIVRICSVLGIEGMAFEKIVRTLLPEEVFNRIDRRSEATFSDIRKSRGRVKLMKFFEDDRIPLLYDTLKIVGESDVKNLRKAFHPRLIYSPTEIENSLNRLTEMGLASKAKGKWKIVDTQRDIVIPSKNANEFGRRLNRRSLSTAQAFLNHSEVERIMRTIVTTVRIPAAGSAVEALRALILRFQDDVLALQGQEDDGVVEVFISAVEVARKNRRNDKAV